MIPNTEPAMAAFHHLSPFVTAEADTSSRQAATGGERSGGLREGMALKLPLKPVPEIVGL
jgi:hypothetical protein